MSETDQQEKVEAAQDNEPMKSHIVCPVCHGPTPPYPLGTQAICGTRVLGIAARPDADRCPKCDDSNVRHKHYMQKHMY